MVAWKQLATLPESELGKCDIAEVNLICAEGLPGAKTIDPSACLEKIEEWTEKVRWQTQKHLERFRRHPEQSILPMVTGKQNE